MGILSNRLHKLSRFVRTHALSFMARRLNTFFFILVDFIILCFVKCVSVCLSIFNIRIEMFLQEEGNYQHITNAVDISHLLSLVILLPKL